MSFIDRINQLEAIVNQLDRRQNNFLREAVVTEVYENEGMAKVDAQGVISKKIPWLQRSGAIREWTPVTKDERVLLISPTGEPGRGLILPGGYTDQFPQPHDKGAEKLVQIDGVSIKQTGSGVTITAGGVVVEITSAGLTVTGGNVVHDGKNIGSTHKHLGVMPGVALTGIPSG
ncbi:hypothetical protein GA830_10590 [Mesorhizobium sp. NBSH29]|uniref:phage baseplate assembly protein V n=1 Tax=Mesorhizobium sp. NBSH29 TaxID=2654249 RepID=UPI0018967589|nr:phage baseplate assembly protein V [Mesorhizobium sp. NBSH29]QPC87141.1 hypothetical protein GA830_10590 [Mesorhizobium sp. NBSH29]